MSDRRELGERFRRRPSAQPNDMSGVIKRALDEVCAIFGATDAMLVWEETEEPWVMVGTRRGDQFTFREEKPADVSVAGQPDGGAHVVAEHHEGSAVDAGVAVQRDPVQPRQRNADAGRLDALPLHQRPDRHDDLYGERPAGAEDDRAPGVRLAGTGMH